MSWDSQNEVNATILRFTLDEAQCCFTVGTAPPLFEPATTFGVKPLGDLLEKQPSASPSLGALKVNQSSRSCAYSEQVLTRGCVRGRADDGQDGHRDDPSHTHRRAAPIAPSALRFILRLPRAWPWEATG